MLDRNLKQELEKRKNRIGLVNTRLEVNELEGNSFSGSITRDFKLISLDYGKDLDLVPDEETKRFCYKSKVRKPERKIGEDVLEHEAGHRENPVRTRYGCPFTPELHDRILDAVTRGLKEKGKEGLEEYVTNAIEDILDNINCRRKTDFAGQTLFWNNQGLVNTENNKFGGFYEAFVKLNMILGRNVSDTTLLRRFYTNDKKVQEAVRSFTDYLKKRLDTGSVIGIHEKDDFTVLFDRDLDKRGELWEDLAYNFTIRLADLLDKKPKEQMFGLAGNGFDKEMKKPQVKQEIAFKRYKQGRGASSHRDLESQLYDLYKRISKEIPVETSSYVEASSMPLVHFGRRFVKEDERKFRFRGLGIGENGEFGVKTTRHNVKFPVSYKTHPKQFPKLKIALMDRSGSMGEAADGGDVGDTSFIPWGDRSKYHFALKGYFGIDNFLERQGIINYVENCVLGFSGEDALRGNAREVAEKLLVNPSGGTSLDVNALEREMEQGSFVLSISDGEFSVNESQKEKLKGKIGEADYAHIQIGSDTRYSSFLKSIGVPVFDVKGDDDLSKVMVSFVSDYYRKPIMENK